MTKRQERTLKSLSKLVDRFGDTTFEWAEWNKDETDEPWERVYGRQQKAEKKLRERLVKLVEKT